MPLKELAADPVSRRMSIADPAPYTQGKARRKFTSQRGIPWDILLLDNSILLPLHFLLLGKL